MCRFDSASLMFRARRALSHRRLILWTGALSVSRNEAGLLVDEQSAVR